MSEPTDNIPPGAPTGNQRGHFPEQQGPELDGNERRRRWLRVGAVVGGAAAAALGAVWLTRERIADSVIAGQLRDLGLSGTYHIDSIGPRREVISAVVIGDPRHPDLTVERAEIEIEPRLGFPVVGRITLVRPRLYGTLHKGKFSLGSLDKVLFAGAPRTEPFRLPDLDLAVIDGRARLDADVGQVGFKLDGAGVLSGGFAGTIAAVAPHLALGDCAAEQASLYGRLTVSAARPRLVGPVRLANLSCADGTRLAKTDVDMDAVADAPLDGGEGHFALSSGAWGAGGVAARGMNGWVDAAWRKGVLAARYDLLGRGLDHAQFTAATIGAKGSLQARNGFARVDLDAQLDGGGLRVGPGLDAAMAGLERAGAGSLIAPLVRQAHAALLREGRASRLAASLTLRRAAGQTTVIVPEGRLAGGSGQVLLALSRVQYASGGAGAAPRLAGNFVTGGAGLPHLAGRMDKPGRGDTLVTLAMADYRAGDARLALPRLVIAQTANGALGLSGEAVVSGPLPGGQARNLVLPIEGNRSPAGVIQLWRRCVTVRFDALAYADLSLDNRSLVLCPQPGGAIVRSDRAGMRVAFGTPSLDLAGHLGATPIRIASGPVGLAWPGGLFARAFDIALGPADAPTRFHIADLKASLGAQIGGTFAGTDVKLAPVPLDLLDASGKWRLVGGRLEITGGAFRLEDRAAVDRFLPLAAEGGALTLADNRIVADAVLREPKSGHEVTRVAIRHDLTSGTGHADLLVDNLLFDDRLQPAMLTANLAGVVANVAGVVKGRGVIDWNPRTVTSSGRFGTDSLDFAAAFGPARGVSGTVEFNDLVGLTTPPGQRLHFASINPGIEVTGVAFQLQPNARLAVEGGTWPFLGGNLRLRPVDLNLGVAETRRYVLDMDGVDAARFVTQMELGNLSATGTFDGTLPLIFDENGGRIEGGLLASRAPGGNVSYVGALTWKDLSTMANFVFDALKSLDYRTMTIAMDGALEGDIVTRVRFDGVKQGSGAKRNFLTRRFANLPLQFNVNINAPFYQLITSFKAMYDPAYVRDPRTIGLLDADGLPVVRTPATPLLSTQPGAIQPPVSEKKP